MEIIGVPQTSLQSIVDEFLSMKLNHDITAHVRRDGRPHLKRVRLVMANPTQYPRKKDDPQTTATKEAMNEFRKRGFSGKWTGAVCYHGYTKVMDKIFERFPEAVIRSKLQTFNGAEDYRAKRDVVGMSPAGSMMNPQQYREQCDC